MNLVIEKYNLLIKKYQKIEKDSTENEIHEKRVILRKIFPILDAYKIKPVKVKNGEKAFKLFGELRDIQVQIIKLKSMEQTPEVAEYLNYLKYKELEINGDVRAFCRREKIGFPQIKSKSDIDKSKIIRKTEKLVRKINKKTQSETVNSAKEIHRIRIEFKKFRYLMDILSNLTFVDKKKLENIRSYQDKLGEIQDYRVLIAGYKSFCKKKRLKKPIIIDIFEENQNTLIEEFVQNKDAFMAVCNDAISFKIALPTKNDEAAELKNNKFFNTKIIRHGK
jgi:CHAD domain-containing protein